MRNLQWDYKCFTLMKRHCQFPRQSEGDLFFGLQEGKGLWRFMLTLQLAMAHLQAESMVGCKWRGPVEVEGSMGGDFGSPLL